VRVSNSLALIEELLTYDTIESEHFVVRHRPGVDALLAAEMLDPLEGIYRRVTGQADGGINHEPSVRTVIELMPDHRWFSVRIAGVPAIHTMAACTGSVIAMEAPRDGPGHMAGPYDWERVIRHEFVHTVTLSRTDNRIPHWFTEAAAVYLEGAPRDFNTSRLLATVVRIDELFDLDEINTAFVRPEKPTDRSQAYAQGHWMYEYILSRWGEAAPLGLMDLYAEGVREEDAFRRVLGISRDEFLEDFEPWARDRVIEWGLIERDGEPTIAELRLGLIRDEEQREKAGELLRHRDPEVAQRLPEPSEATLREWLTEHPDHTDCLEQLIRVRLEITAGEPDDELLELLMTYARLRPVDPMPHRELAAYHLAGSDPTLAIPHLEYLDARETNEPTYAAALARRYAEAGRWADAWRSALRAVRISPYDADHRELAATVAIRRGQLDTAREQIVALTVLEPDREIHRRRLAALDARLNEDG
jgi:hypothetical protein